MSLESFGRFKRFMQPMPPIGLASIAATLMRDGHTVSAIDNFVEQLSHNDLVDRIVAATPRVVGISCLTPSAACVYALARRVKELLPQTTVVLGNIHASFFAEKIVAEKIADIVVHEDGELVFSTVVRTLEQGKPLEEVHGITFLRDDKPVNTPHPTAPLDLDALPYPAWEIFPYHAYGFLPFMDIQKPAISIIASRGCVHKCTYCSLVYRKSGFCRRDMVCVVDEVEYVVKRFGARQIGFVDPMFPFRKADGLVFCREMVKRGLHRKVIWIAETRIDAVDKELLEAMKESGCRRLLYGIETGTADMLAGINKNISLKKTREVITLTRQCGIESVGLFMIGLPGETREMIEETIRFSQSLDLDFAKFAIAIPFPGSALYEKFVASGNGGRDDWENFITYNPDPVTLPNINGVLSSEELIAYQRRAHRAFYVRAKMIYHHLFRVRSIRLRDMLLSCEALFFHGK